MDGVLPGLDGLVVVNEGPSSKVERLGRREI